MDNLVANGVYHPGEGIHLKIRFQHGAGINRIKVTFVHEFDRTERITLSGIPNKQGEGEWLAILSGRATGKMGAYTAINLRAEFDGGHEVAFRTPLQNATLVVKELPVWLPALVGDWVWASD